MVVLLLAIYNVITVMKDQFLDISGRMGHKVNVGERTAMQISVWDINVQDKEKNNCSADPDFDSCLYGILEKEMALKTKDNCTVPWTRNNSRICSETEDTKSAFYISWNRGTNQVIVPNY